jgi:hypothetical protein
MRTEKDSNPWPTPVCIRDCSYQLRSSGVIASICIGLVCKDGWPRCGRGEWKGGRIGLSLLFVVGTADELDAKSKSIRGCVLKGLGKIFRCSDAKYVSNSEAFREVDADPPTEVRLERHIDEWWWA